MLKESNAAYPRIKISDDDGEISFINKNKINKDNIPTMNNILEIFSID